MRRLMNNQGYALLLVLLFVVVMAVTMTALSIKMTNNLKQSSQEQDFQGSYYIAEGGIETVLQMINEISFRIAADEKSVNSFFVKLESEILREWQVDEFSPNGGEAPIAKVLVSKVDNGIPRQYRIESIGQIGNRERRVAGVFSVDFEEGESGITFPPGLGVFAKTMINLNNGYIKGNIMIDSTSGRNVVVGGNPTIDGTIILPPGASNNTFQAPQWWMDSKSPTIEKRPIEGEYPLPPFPNFPPYPLPQDISQGGHQVIRNGNLNINHWTVSKYTHELNENQQFNNINLDSNYRLIFDIGNRNVSLVVNRIAGNGHIDIKGTGTLTMYIKDNISIDGAFNESNTAKAFLYVGASQNPSSPKTIRSSDYARFNGSIYAKDANIQIGGSAGLNGHIITGGKVVHVTGGSSATSASGGNIVYAPNAEVHLNGSGRLTGSVIARSFTISGGGSVVSEEIQVEENPYFPGGDDSNGVPKINWPDIKEIQN